MSEHFDVFLCHNSEDKPAVIEIASQLRQKNIRPWLDIDELPPGLPWQRELEEQIPKIKSAAVFIGPNGIGPWQDQEIAAFLREFVRRNCPVIPVMLPECADRPELPVFLSGMTWVDFRHGVPDPIERLIWGITGDKVKLTPDSLSAISPVNQNPDLKKQIMKVSKYQQNLWSVCKTQELNLRTKVLKISF